jgi:hypothetical protein
MSNSINDYLNNKKGSKEHIKSNTIDPHKEYLRNYRGPVKSSNVGAGEFATNVGEDTTNNDFLDPNYIYGTSRDTNELRASKQGWGSKAASGVGQFAAKAGLEATKTLAVLGGLAASPFADGDWTETAFNNPFIKSLENAEDWVDNEAVPVYVKEAVQNGGFFDKVSSIDFWATEGADGLGFIAAMFAPGAALRGLKVGNTLAKGGIRGTKAFNKLVGRSKYVDDAVNDLNQGGKWFGANAEKIDNITTSGFNTLSEAGIEAGGAMQSYEDEIFAEYESGKISYEEYNKQLAKKGEIGRNVFLGNLAVLAVPNYINSSLLYGKRGTKQAVEIGKKMKKRNAPDLISGATSIPGKAIQGARNSYNKFKVSNFKAILDDYPKAFGREGLIEEAGQSTMESFFTKKAKDGDADFLEEYLTTLGSTDGQIAMFLGTAFGGTMQAASNYGNRKKADLKYNALADYVNENIEAFNTVLSGDVYKKDKDGKIQFEVN